jgi:hypothetical protein
MIHAQIWYRTYPSSSFRGSLKSRAWHGNESNNLYVLELPCPFRQTMSHSFRVTRLFWRLFVWRGWVTRIGVAHNNYYSVTSPLTWEFGCEKKFPWGELNMLVRPSDSWLLILLHATHQAENSSVFSRHFKVIHKVTLSFNPILKQPFMDWTLIYIFIICASFWVI